MNNKALTLSVVMAIIAVFFVQSYVTSIEDEAKKKFGTEVNVVVAKKDIKEMSTIDETMLEFRVFPKRFLEPASISFEETEEEKSDSDKKEKHQTRTLKGLVGNVAIVPLKKGEQLTYNKLTDPSVRTGLSPQIAPGKRAVSIGVTEISSVSKLVKPGDRVDLIAVVDAGGGKDNKVAKTVLQDIVILSIGRYVTNNVARVLEGDVYGGKDKVRSLAEDFSFSSITVEVDPVQAQTLALILNSGDSGITLSLRNNDDTDRTNLPGVVMGDILGADAARVKPKK